MMRWFSDVRYAVRGLAARPGLVVSAVLVLGVAAGANAAMLGVIQAVLFRDLPYPDAARLVAVDERRSGAPSPHPVAAANYLEWQDHARFFEALGAWAPAGSAVMGLDEPQAVRVARGSSSLFDVLGVSPALGRLIVATDEHRDERVAVLTTALWQQALGGDPGVIGTSLNLDGTAYTIVGVAPPEVELYVRADVWLPLALPAIQDEGRVLRVVARLEPGVSIDEARIEMNDLARRLESMYPETNEGFGAAAVTPLRDRILGRVNRLLLLLWAAVGLLLPAACGSVVSLQIARAEKHRRQVAIRLSLGASRWSLLRPAVAEGVFVGLLAGGLGLTVAISLLLLLPARAPIELPRASDIALDGGIAALTLAVSIVCGAVCSIAPVLRPRLRATGSSMDQVDLPGGAPGRSRLLGTLVAVQAALAMVLIAGTAMAARGALLMQQANPGFDPAGVWTAEIKVPLAAYPGAGAQGRLYQRVIERLEAIPGVEAVGATSVLPVAGPPVSSSLALEGASAKPAEPVLVRLVTPDYFRALGVPLAAGRMLASSDTHRSAAVAVVNRTMARRIWPGDSPVGQRFRLELTGPRWIDAVGVVADVREASLTESAPPTVYMSPLQVSSGGEMALVIRGSAEPAMLASEIREAVHAIDPGVPVSPLRSLEDVLAESTLPNRFTAVMLGAFASFAVLLVALATYAVTSCAVTRRSREFGVRSALGARPRQIKRLAMREGRRFGLFGIAFGIAGAVPLARVTAASLPGLGRPDPASLAASATLLAIVVLLACYLPARRAARIDPSTVLRT